MDTTRYENLQQKYGFLQREYSGGRTRKMEQYRVEKLDNHEEQSDFNLKYENRESNLEKY